MRYASQLAEAIYLNNFRNALCVYEDATSAERVWILGEWTEWDHSIDEAVDFIETNKESCVFQLKNQCPDVCCHSVADQYWDICITQAWLSYAGIQNHGDQYPHAPSVILDTNHEPICVPPQFWDTQEDDIYWDDHKHKESSIISITSASSAASVKTTDRRWRQTTLWNFAGQEI